MDYIDYIEVEIWASTKLHILSISPRRCLAASRRFIADGDKPPVCRPHRINFNRPMRTFAHLGFRAGAERSIADDDVTTQ